jgi:hypothetical protein
MSKTEIRKVPSKAMQFEAGRFQFGESEEPTRSPISMLGRSAEPIDHWYFGKVIHDMAGFRTDHPRVPIDWAHDDYSDEGIGYLDTFTADEHGLMVSGELVSVEPNDRADKLRKKAAAGVPYQASIFFRGEKFEEVPEGYVSQVNGQEIEGPAIIVRQWALRGMAVCLYGADHRTESQFSDDAGEVSITIETETEMATKKKEVETPEVDTQLTEPQETTTPVVEEVKPNPEQFRTELKNYITAFGAEDGANWFAEGLSFTDAQAKFCEKLQGKLSAEKQRADDLAEKLSSIDRGSDKPLEFSSDDMSAEKTNDRFAHLGPNLSRFANGLKLPTN